MFSLKLLVVIYLLQETYSKPALSIEDAECKTLEQCPHLNSLINSKEHTYGIRVLLNLLHCKNDRREITLKCVTPKKLEDLVAKAILLPNENECGLDPPEQKIADGTLTEIDEHFWVALLKYRDHNGKLSYGCHANLINNRYLLTAAHCVDLSVSDRRRLGSIYSVVLGEYDVSNDGPDCVSSNRPHKFCADEIKEILVESYITHPDYNKESKVNDIALIRMNSTVSFTEYIQPVCLPPLNLIPPNYEEVLWITGWGSNENDVMNKKKVKAKFRVNNKNTCEIENLTSTQFCATPLDNSRTCPSDSGGPLLMRRAIGGDKRWFLIGIDSLGGLNCGLVLQRTAIYTQVSPFIDWIFLSIHQ